MIDRVTDRIRERSLKSRGVYLDRMHQAAVAGPVRAHLSCGNQAHAYAAMTQDKAALAEGRAPNIGIVTAYNDMLSAHQPYEHYPELIRATARRVGATAQVAGGVPAMCDGVTQGQPGMEMSLFSRDVIAMAAGIALSHNTFDAALYLGVCDKIVPGLIIAAATFGHIPAVFVPAGPMSTGLPNEEKSRVRNAFAAGDVGRNGKLSRHWHLHLLRHRQHQPDADGIHGPPPARLQFRQPRHALAGSPHHRRRRTRLCHHRPRQRLPPGWRDPRRARLCQRHRRPDGDRRLHQPRPPLPAMARASGVLLDLQDFDDLSAAVPLMAKVYPNGMADVNAFHAAGGLGFLMRELMDAGLLHDDAKTIMGDGLAHYRMEPKLQMGRLVWQEGAAETLNDKIVRPVATPFAATGGLKQLTGNLGRGVIKVSAVAPERHIIEAPIRIFHQQADVKDAFKAGEFTSDTIVVVRFQGPQANGMPELHSLTPTLSILQERGLKVALVTDGRMSGASGKVPAAIHVSPEAAAGGPLARLRDGDLTVLAPDFETRAPVTADLSHNAWGLGRELFASFRAQVGPSTDGASSLY
jgi:phosphogluconate dehydratase